MVWQSLRQFFNNLIAYSPAPTGPVIISAGDHPIKRASIDSDAVRVSTKLRKKGFTTYLVGGSVRDLLLNKKPKDYDMATDARPNQVKRLFPNCRLIGKRFRLAHITFSHHKIIEVATFRNEAEFVESKDETGFVISNNTFGTPGTDAMRRDITINGLFYNFEDGSIIDYVGGLKDLKHGLIRSIADPEIKFREDPVRMMRAVRHASRCDFNIEDVTAASIRKNASLLGACSRSRLLEEINRDLFSGCCEKTFRLLKKYSLLKYILPGLEGHNPEDQNDILWSGIASIDKFISEGNPMPYPVPWALLIYADMLARESSPSFSSVHIRENISAFGPAIAIPRKHKERMVQVITMKDKVMRWKKAGKPDQAIKSRNYFQDTLLFTEVLHPEGTFPPELKSSRKKPRRRKPARRRRKTSTAATKK